MAPMAATMLPTPAALAPFDATDRITVDGRPTPAFRDQLRRIPSVRNAFAVASVYAQTVGLIVLAIWVNNPFLWVATFVLMGRAHAQFAALMHEAAHRLLFRNRRRNDWVGRWLLGFPSFTPTDLYRRGHMAHHREEFGPNEPDIPLYRGYPISRSSLRRKLVRDATGQTGWKLFKGLLRATRSDNEAVRSQSRSIVAVQVGLLAIFAAAGYWWLYFVLWLAPFLTVWRVINRLRAIAEHGGMEQSKDRRRTTHTVRQHWPARFLMVPNHIGWHLAHHVDPGVPMARLPQLHRELRRAGYVNDDLEYGSYPELWRKLGSGREAGEGTVAPAA
jgi:fatty acid desaturase